MPKNKFTTFSGALFILLWISGIYIWSAIGLSITLFFFLKVVDNMGHKIPILDIMTTIASLQWIIGPYIDYHNEINHFKYHMYVDEQTYMAYVVPAVLLFRLGTLIFKDKINLDEQIEKIKILFSDYPRLPYYLIISGLIAPFISNFVSNTFAFVFFLLSNVKYIGAIYLIFSDKKDRWIIFIITLGFTIVASLATGMFHDLLLWSILTFTFISKELNLNFNLKLLLAVIGVFFAITIQSIKTQYREFVWEKGYKGNKIVLFGGLAVDQWKSGEIFTPTSDQDINIRLNQGWIISAIMNQVPNNVEYANGSTIKEGVIASLLPRFLVPNKKKAGGSENFEKFTGFQLQKNTSMGISLIGEGWANYGYWGGLVFMFCWGLFVSWFWNKLNALTKFFPTLLIWSPILFLQVIKAETEFVVVLNHLIKSSILVFGIFWLFKDKLGVRI